MGESQKIEDDRFMDSILDSLKLGEVLKSFSEHELSNTIKYPSYLARLSGYKPNIEFQDITLNIKSEKDLVKIEISRAMVDSFLALLATRYGIFGPLNQYPKQFLIGPDLLSKSTSASDDETMRPKVRDVDRLIWIRVVDINKTYLGCVDFYNDDMKIPSVVYMDYRAYSLSTNGEVAVTSQNINDDINQIFSNFLSNAKSYGFSLYSRKPLEIQAKKCTYPYAFAMWIAMSLSMNRTRTDITKISEINVEAYSQRMIKSTILGVVGYTYPTDVHQKDEPVPIGEISNERLLDILKTLVLDNSTATIDSEYINPYDELEKENSTKPITDRNVVTVKLEKKEGIATPGNEKKIDLNFINF